MSADSQQPKTEQQPEADDWGACGSGAEHPGAGEQCDQGGGLHGSSKI